MSTEEFLAQVRAEHVLTEQMLWYEIGPVCLDCEQPWPCPTERLARAVESMIAHTEPPCHGCFDCCDSIRAVIAEHLEG